MFTQQIQSIYKIKRDDFTEVLLSPTFGPLKIASHKGAFYILHLLDLTARPSWTPPILFFSVGIQCSRLTEWINFGIRL